MFKKMPSFYFFSFIFMLVSFPLQAQKVYLNRIDSIRVKLFDTNSIDKISITAYHEPIQLQLDFKYPITLNSDESALIMFSNSVFTLKLFNRELSARKISVISSKKGLIQTSAGKLEKRYYHGKLDFNPITGLKPINTIALEDYIASVVGSEMNFTNVEALKVQAVISRTYALWNLGTIKNTEYDLSDHTLNQVYNGELIEKPWFREAAEETLSEVALFSNKLILAVFSSTCGGHTCNNESVWSGQALPYLRGNPDNDACKSSPHFRWRFSIENSEWSAWLQKTFHKLGSEIHVFQRSEDNRVKTLQFDDLSKPLKANDFRLKVLQSFGTRSLKSTLFVITNTADSVIFMGRGMGHGVGLCQWGALGLAEDAWTYKDILRFYYRGIEIKPVYFDSDRTFLELAN